MKKLAIVILILILLGSCSVHRVCTEPVGTVMAVDGNSVKVGFPVLEDEQIKGMNSNWFIFRNGHNYKINDRYPDSQKETPGDWIPQRR